MADQRNARPVSGEIMTGRATFPGKVSGAQAAGDVIEADFEVLPSLASGPEPAPSPHPASASAPQGMEMLRQADRQSGRRGTSRGGPVFWIAGTGLALAAFWVSGGHAVVRGMPLFAHARAGSALSISGVTSRVETSGLKPVLIVDGEAGNDGARAEPLPPLDIAVTGNDGRITRFTLGTSGQPLAPGERFAFSSRLEVPRNGVTTVAVSFAE